MTSDTMLVFAAASLFLVLLPGPLGDLPARYALSRGAPTALLTVPATALGLVAAMTVASVPVVLMAVHVPRLFELLSWFGLAYLFAYTLWALQHPTRAYRGDNDNLPERRPIRIALHLFRHAALKARWVMAFLALLLNVFDRQAALADQLVRMDVLLIGAALLGGVLNIAFAGRKARRLAGLRAKTPASRKSPTRFISRRAVTAGYRRIAA